MNPTRTLTAWVAIGALSILTLNLAQGLEPRFEPAPIMLPAAPPPRQRAEVEAILGSALTAPPPSDAKPLHLLLCASEKDAAHHQPGYHDYPLWRERWSRLLSFAKGITVETADIWPTAEQWRHSDEVVFNSYNPAWASEKDPAKAAALANDLDTFLARGGGLVSLHYAMNAGPYSDALAARLGLAWRGGSKFRHGASDWVLDKHHPLAAGFTEFKIPDESYWNLAGDLAAAGASTLATSVEENAPRPQMWTREAGPGRVFVSIPGHFTWTYDDPLYRILIFRGMMWCAHQPIDRLAPLVMIGARVE